MVRRTQVATVALTRIVVIFSDYCFLLPRLLNAHRCSKAYKSQLRLRRRLQQQPNEFSASSCQLAQIQIGSRTQTRMLFGLEVFLLQSN